MILLCIGTKIGINIQYFANKKGQKLPPEFYIFLHCCVCNLIILVEKHRDAPNSCKSDNRIYNSCKKSCSATANPSDKVKRKQTDKSPVECTDYCNGKCNFIDYHNYDFLSRTSSTYSFAYQMLKNKWKNYEINQSLEYRYQRRLSAFRATFFLFLKRKSVKF